MKKSSYIFILLLFISIPIIKADTINADTTWKGQVNIYDDVYILPSATLTIDSATNVIFYGYYKIDVRGRIIAEGKSWNSAVLFTIADTTGFSDTSSVAGSWNGIEFRDFSGNESDSSRLTYCIIEYCKAMGDSADENEGGALYFNNYSNAQIKHCRIRNNKVWMLGGGICLKNYSSPLISCNSIYNNNAIRKWCEGGGIYCGPNCEPYIYNNWIYLNKALNMEYFQYYVAYTGAGGGLYLGNSDIAMERPPTFVINNIICNNFSTSGGGIYETDNDCYIIGNIICNNDGPGIFNGHDHGNGKYINNTICNNSNYGIVCFSSNLKFINNIIWNNASNNYEDQLLLHDDCEPLVEYCNIEHGYPGTGNMDTVPFFSDPQTQDGAEHPAYFNDWSLLNISNCMNKGNPDTTGLMLPLIDAYDYPRITGDRIDIGAIENKYMTFINDNTTDRIFLTVYPNPATDVVNILSSENIISVKLENAFGQMLINNAVEGNNTALNTSSLSAGVYYMQIETADGITSRKISVIK